MMKKKIISRALFLALAGGLAFSVTSCKDTSDDLYLEFSAENASLGARLDKLAGELDEAKKGLNDRIDDLVKVVIPGLDKKIGDLNKEIEDLKRDLDNNYYTKDEVDQKVKALNDLIAQHDKKLKELDDAIKALTSCTCDKEAIQEMKNAIDALKAAGVTDLDKVTVDNLKELSIIKDALVGLSDISGDLSDLAAKKNDLNTVLGLVNNVETLNELAGMKDQLQNLLDNPVEPVDLSDLNHAVFEEGGVMDLTIKRVEALEGLNDYFKKEDGTVMTVEEFQTALNNGTWLTNYKESIESVKGLLDDELLTQEALQALKDNYANFDEMFDKVDAVFNTLFPGATIDENGNIVLPEGLDKWYTYEELIKKVIANENAITELQGQIDNLSQRFDDLVTGLVLQTTENPVFGGFNTPFGLNSMVLMSYYGKATQDVNFPYESCEDAGYKAPLNVAQGESQVYANWLYSDELGKLYFTVNPVAANVNLNGFSIENSVGVKAPVALTDITPSSKELNFGFRALEGNGFYEASVKLNKDNVEQNLQQIKVNIEPGLVDALKDVVKNHRMTDVTALAKVVYSNLQNVCTANALRYDWTTKDADGNDIENSVLSNYGMAVTAIKPLSFTTLRGTSIDRKLPTFGEISIDKSNFDLGIEWDNINIDDFNITCDVQINIDHIHFDAVGNTIVTVKVPKKFDVSEDKQSGSLPDNWEDDPAYYDEVDVDITNHLQEVVDKLQESVNNWVDSEFDRFDDELSEEINNAISEAVDNALNGPNGIITQINDNVNDMIGQVQGKIDDLIDRVNGSGYLKNLNKVIGKYNSLAEKINKRLSDPNHYLQVAMFFENNGGGISMLSNASGSYSKFKYNGGEGINLWATTYNFETLCPVYKKYVAVTKVLVDGVEKPELIAAANSGADMNKVLEGSRKALTFATNNVVTSGHVYSFEITYRALDFHGHTSTNKYYIVVDAK